MRWIAFLLFVTASGFGLAVGCTPVVIDHNSEKKGSEKSTADAGPQEKGGSDAQAADQGGSDKGPTDDSPTDNSSPNPCKDDCDCLGGKGVCESNSCTTLVNRVNNCPKCDDQCKAGTRCEKSDGSVGTCQGTSCKDDCDCLGGKGVCESGSCTTLVNRVNNCPKCDAQCKAGERCVATDGKLATCAGPGTCKHDCDCFAKGEVCGSDGKCSTIDRRSACLACDDGSCLAGQPCHNKDKSIGTCKPTPCKDDCDCLGGKGVCESGGCTTLPNRPNNCPKCSAQCKRGERCEQSDGSIGTCVPQLGDPCKSDCDCYPRNCDANKCSATKRVNLCPQCTDANCPKGDPCFESKTQSVGVCGGGSGKPKLGDPCKTDCDCVLGGYNCDANKCSATRRLNRCPQCSGSNCPKGDPCYDGTKQAIGVCGGGSGKPKLGDPCKTDCDCVLGGYNCDSGKCSATRRVNTCPQCNSANCPKGSPCYTSTSQPLGTCSGATTFTCGNKTCDVKTEFCQSTTGGAPPSCAVLPPVTGNCPSHCNDAGLSCSDGKKRCYCPSYSCNKMKTPCTDCTCLNSSGSYPKGACFCKAQGGGLHVSCAAP